MSRNIVKELPLFAACLLQTALSAMYIPAKTLTVEEFIARYGDNSRYELADGEEYRQQKYRLGKAIASPLFPGLQLRLDDVLPR